MNQSPAPTTRITRDNLGFLLAKASQRWNELLADQFRRAGYPDIKPAYGSILLPLLERDGLRMGELARRSRLSKQTMTTMIRLMERDGLVAKQRDRADARAHRVYLTTRARGFRRVAERVLMRMDKLVTKRLSRVRAASLTESLRSIMELGRARWVK